jgi:Protein of unknown function (DUF2787).
MFHPFTHKGVTLPVDEQLQQLLHQEAIQYRLTMDGSDPLTFHFDYPPFHSEQGPIHPVTIQLLKNPQGWYLHTITDFGCPDITSPTRLTRELHFDLQRNEHFILNHGPLPQNEACELFRLWQREFIAHYHTGCFQVSIDRG